MQEFALNGVRLPLPALDLLQGAGEWPSGIEEPDDQLLAQFEDLMPSPPAGPEGQPDTDTVADNAIAGVGSRSADSAAAAVSQGGAEWQRVNVSCAEPDGPSSEFSVHHSKIGVVHVQQNSDRNGGSIKLRTDDVLLRERLRGATAGLQAVMMDASGRAPDVAIES
jgi:hypothetical protein